MAQVSVASGPIVFDLKDPGSSGLAFRNDVGYCEDRNILTFHNIYNGGGVAIGDVDGDGLDDVFLTSNKGMNRLFRNLGGMKFMDITDAAGVGGHDGWTTGACMADVNGDGLLDIYVSYSGLDRDDKTNELWINQGDFRFSNQAAEYGLDDRSTSTQGLFFDFDNDGDLDLFLLNQHTKFIPFLELNRFTEPRHPTAGDKLYRNENGKFIDISEEAGIYGSAFGMGLGVGATDINQDGWVDLIVTNDFNEPDYLYVNQNGVRFKEQLADYFPHTSYFSMGLDIADINNDGLMEVFTLDMLPEDNYRQKKLYDLENYELYNLMLEKGFYHQLMRNMLQLNLGGGKFVEVGQALGISNTDWSWSALFLDADNDGFKDLFVTNGIPKDCTDRDFLRMQADYALSARAEGKEPMKKNLVDLMSSTPVRNYFFRNTGNPLGFERIPERNGFSPRGFSTGAAYGDLDNDGDLDLVVNNVNGFAELHENKSETGNWIRLTLRGGRQNTDAIGARVTVRTKNGEIVQEQFPVRGFQSSSSPKLHIGLGRAEIEDVSVWWPGGDQVSYGALKRNQHHILQELKPGEAKVVPEGKASAGPPLLRPATMNLSSLIDQEVPSTLVSEVNDFKRQPLLMTMYSHIGPVLATANLDSYNGEELFVGGYGTAGPVVLSRRGDVWETYQELESIATVTDAVAIFHDFNADGHTDLFVGSGGYRGYSEGDEHLNDRLYLNDRTGRLIKQEDFPGGGISTGTASVLDLNGDNYPDLFVGGRIVPGQYPKLPNSRVLINDGQGQFDDRTEEFLAEPKLGMLTASLVQDVNGDGRNDLILFGEMMSPMVLLNTGGRLVEASELFDKSLSGWWLSAHQADFDGDGDLDVVAGNFGINSQLRASKRDPLRLYASDFDDNGVIDPIFEGLIGDGRFPLATKDDLSDQMYYLRSKFATYSEYASAQLTDIFSPEQLAAASMFEVRSLKSMFFKNTGQSFEAVELPLEAQFFPVYAIQSQDLNGDGNPDLVLGGNQAYTRLRHGQIAGSHGLVLLGQGDGTFIPVSAHDSGFSVQGDIKSIVITKEGSKLNIFVGAHNRPIQLFEQDE